MQKIFLFIVTLKKLDVQHNPLLFKQALGQALGMKIKGLIGAFLLAFVLPSMAQKAQTIEQNNELKSIQSEINSLDKKISVNEKKISSEKDSLQEIEQDISKTRKEVKTLDNKIQSLENKIASLTETVASQKEQVDEQIGLLENVMIKQYKDKESVLMKLLLNQKDPEDVDRMQQYYQYYTKSQAETINKARAEIADYLATKKELDGQQQTLASAKENQAELIAKLETQQQARQKNIRQLDNEISQDANALSRLQLDQQRLKRLIKELQLKAKQKEIAERKAALAKAQEMARIKAELEKKKLAEAQAQAQAQAQKQAQQRAEQERQANLEQQKNAEKENKEETQKRQSIFGSRSKDKEEKQQKPTPSSQQNNAMIATNVPAPPPTDASNIIVEPDQPKKQPKTSKNGLGQLKGRLPYPLKGRLLATYGSHKSGSGLTWNGILIEAPIGSSVHAVADGEVVYADWFRGYGQMVVIDHGQGYMTLYSHNSEVTKGVGSHVRQNDEIAKAGDSGGLKSSGLYFELRYNGQAVNPTSWLR